MGFKIPSNLIWKPRCVGLQHLPYCSKIVFCRKITCACRQRCIKQPYQDPVLSVLCLVLKVNVFPSSERVRSPQLPCGPPLSNTCLIFFLIYQALSFPICKPDFTMCHSAHTDCMNKCIFQSRACLHMKKHLAVLCAGYLQSFKNASFSWNRKVALQKASLYWDWKWM